jgi:hypothetical protein
MKTINEFQIIPHGIENSQYFQGCGISHTKFTDCATGIGSTAAEAFEDACESLAQNGWETESLACPADYKTAKTVQSHLKENGVDGESDEAPDVYWHISVRVR